MMARLPYFRRWHKEHKTPLCEFGETIQYMVAHHKKMPKLESRFYKGIWLGKDTMTSESIVGIAGKIIRTRTINWQLDDKLNQKSMTDNWWTSSMRHHGHQSHQQKHYSQQWWYQPTQQVQHSKQQQRHKQQLRQHSNRHKQQKQVHHNVNLQVQHISKRQLLTYQWQQHRQVQQEDNHCQCRRDNNKMRLHKAVNPNNKGQQSSSNQCKDLKQTEPPATRMRINAIKVTTKRGETNHHNNMWRCTRSRN